MSKALAKMDPIAAPTLRADGRLAIPSLPAWLALPLGALESDLGLIKSGKFGRRWRLPLNLMPTVEQRDLLKGAVRSLQALASMTPEKSDDAAKTTLVLITKMIKTLSGPRMDEIGAEASGEAYMMALEDVPCWAVANALRRWYRNEVPGKTADDTKWRPMPPELRTLALSEAYAVDGQLSNLRGLLAAEPIAEYSAEARAANLARLTEIFRLIRAQHVDPIDALRDRCAQAGEIPLATSGAP